MGMKKREERRENACSEGGFYTQTNATSQLRCGRVTQDIKRPQMSVKCGVLWASRRRVNEEATTCTIKGRPFGWCMRLRPVQLKPAKNHGSKWIG